MQVQVLSAHPVDLYWRVSLLLWFPLPSISPEIGIRVIGVVLPSQIHTNVWGPSPIKTLGNKSYYISFMDDKTCYTQTYLLALKSDTFKAYLKYEAWLHTKYGVTVKMLCSDRSSEYLS